MRTHNTVCLKIHCFTFLCSLSSFPLMAKACSPELHGSHSHAMSGQSFAYFFACFQKVSYINSTNYKRILHKNMVIII